MAPTTLLVPPRRLGALLRQARIDAGRDLTDLCAVDLSFADLDDIEHGRRDLDEEMVARLAEVYGVSDLDLVPARSQLVIDLDAGRIAVDRADVSIAEGHGPDAVLTRYLALVYRLRGLPVGARIPLRDVDLDVLSHALTLSVDSVDQRLHRLMASGDDVVADQRRIRRQLLLPLAGVIIAATGVGTLLIVSDGEQRPSANSLRADGSVAEISTAAIEQRPIVTELGNGGAIEINPGS